MEKKRKKETESRMVTTIVLSRVSGVLGSDYILDSRAMAAGDWVLARYIILIQYASWGGILLIQYDSIIGDFWGEGMTCRH